MSAILLHMQSFEKAKEEVDQIIDGLGMPIDEKIKKTVIALRMMRVNTDGSCEGHTKWGLPYPWVGVSKYLPEKDESGWIKDNMIEREKVEPLVNEFNARYAPEFPLILERQGIFKAFRIQSFSGNKEVDPNHLEEYQKAMDAFADFVINKYSADS